MDLFGAIAQAFDSAEGYYFLLQLAVIVLAIKSLGHVSVRLGQPSVFGKLLAGIILGPSLINFIQPTPLISELAEIGVILLMFLAGLETDIKEFSKSAFASTMVAIGGVVLPFLGGFGVALLFDYQMTTAVFIGTLLVATSVSISVQTLRELGKLKSKEGVTVLGAAVLDDVLGVIVLSAVLGFTAAGTTGAEASGFASLAILLVKIIVFFAIAIALGYYVLPKFISLVSQFQVTQVMLSAAIISALVFAYLGEVFGIAGIVGAYVCGLMLGMTPHRDELAVRVEGFSFPFFVPMFFFNIGLVANFREMSTEIILFSIVLTLVAIGGKVVGGAIGALVSKFNFRSSLVVGCGMVARGEVGLIIAMIGIDRGIISNDLFGAAIIVVVVTTLVTPPLLKLAIPKKDAVAE